MLSSPEPPLSVSSPVSPERILLPLFPVRVLFKALPVALILEDPKRYRFSTSSDNVKLTLERIISVPSENKLFSFNYYQRDWIASIIHENIIGFQFHPERSGIHGLRLLDYFVKFLLKGK